MSEDLTAFEKDLCNRIIEICKFGKIPCGEENLQLALCFSCPGSIDKAFANDKKTSKKLKYKELNLEFIIFNNAEIELKTGPCSYIKTDIFKYEINPKKKFEIFPLFSKHLWTAQFNHSIDIAYEVDDKYNLLEIKYPRWNYRWDYRWKYSQWGSPDFKSQCPFSTPFLEIDNNKYIMGMYQEGQMFTDFIRLLGAKNVGLQNGKQVNDLYFVAFFRNDDFTKDLGLRDLPTRLDNIFKYYFSNNFNHIVTLADKKGRGPIDLWNSDEPAFIEYFYCNKDTDLVKKKFNPSQENQIKLLYGEKLTALLLKITPMNKGKLKKISQSLCYDNCHDHWYIIPEVKTNIQDDIVIQKQVEIMDGWEEKIILYNPPTGPKVFNVDKRNPRHSTDKVKLA